MGRVLVAPRGTPTVFSRGLRQDPGVILRLDWVWRKTEKGPWPQVVEVPGGGPTAVEGMPTPVGTPRLRPDKGKRKAVLESKVPKRVRRRLSPAPPIFESGSLESNIFLLGSGRLLSLITIHQGPPEISHVEMCRLREEVEGLREDARVARQERDEAVWVRNVLLRDCNASLEWLEAQLEEVEQLQAQLTQEAAGSLTGAPGFMAPSAQEVKAMANESESRRRDWLLRKVAAARLGPGALAAPECSVLRRVVHGRGAGEAGDDSKGGAGSRALVKAFVEGLRTPPLLKEIVQAAWKSLEAEFSPRGGQGESEEGREGGD
ncbi:hypothetical protein C0992_008359 [Termitomyces sp. T32_za158]|nr:hypothetical protein C0992_008359 [Termitomyces sp. T32_za158]